MIEALKSIGSIVGLLTGVTYFYDRLAKGRPIASLTISKQDGRKRACIRVVNASQYDIAITDFDVHPATYFLSETLDTRDIVRGTMGHKKLFMLKPQESKELIVAPLFKDNLALEAGAPHRVVFSFSWRRGNATWLPQLPVTVRTSTTTIRLYGLESD
jgi:hypothetical protein